MSGWEKPGTNGGPFTPARWADTPTHVFPLRMISAEVCAHTGSRSMPPLTFNHSSTTVPSKRAVSTGRRTSSRVEKVAVPVGVVDQRPSLPSAVPGAGPYVVASPRTNHSSST